MELTKGCAWQAHRYSELAGNRWASRAGPTVFKIGGTQSALHDGAKTARRFVCVDLRRGLGGSVELPSAKRLRGSVTFRVTSQIISLNPQGIGSPVFLAGPRSAEFLLPLRIGLMGFVAMVRQRHTLVQRLFSAKALKNTRDLPTPRDAVGWLDEGRA